MSDGAPSRLAAVWFADLAGYSRLASRDEETAIALAGLLRTVVAEVLAEHQGRLVKSTGDGALAEFASADAAVRSAMELAQRFAERASVLKPGARIRVGVHAGEIVPGDDGDLYGDGVNTAARLQQSADPGQVVVSEDIWRSLRQRATYRFTPLRERRLKGLAAPIRVFQVEPGEGVARRGAPAIGRLRSVVPRARILYAAAAILAGVLVFGVLARQRDARNEAGAASASLAVLPLDNLSPDPEDDYLADGLTEELTGALGRLQGLEVAGRTSSSIYRAENLDVREIGERLGVGSVLTGSVRRAGERFRVNVQLVDARTGYQQWSETYDRELVDVFAVQEEIARAVAGALDLRLPRGVEVFRVRSRAPDPEAYDLYLRGRHAWRRRTREGLGLAVDHFRRAIARDPDFAEAHAGLADAHLQLVAYRYRSRDEDLPAAREALERALALDPELGEAYATRGVLRARVDHAMDAALADFRRAIDLEPSYPGAYHWYAVTLTELGRLEESLPVYRRALELDPLAPSLWGAYAWTIALSGDLARAEEVAQRASGLAPEFYGPLTVLSRIYEAQDRGEEAIRAAEQAVSLAPGNPRPEALLARANARFGERGRAREILARLEAAPEPCAACIAEVYLSLGDREGALRWLDAKIWDNLGGSHYPKVDPIYDPLRDDPRFLRFLRDIGFE